MPFSEAYPTVLGSIPAISKAFNLSSNSVIVVNKTFPVTTDPVTKAMQNITVFSYSQTMKNPIFFMAENKISLDQAKELLEQGFDAAEKGLNVVQDGISDAVEKGGQILGEGLEVAKDFMEEYYTSENLKKGAMYAFDKGSPFISPFLGFEYNEEGDYFYTNETSMQSNAGFADIIEYGGGPLGMDIATLVIPFKTSEYEYRVQLWKGNYGFSNAIGAEIGIYYRPLIISGWSPYDGGWGADDLLDWYACVPEGLQWRLIQEIYLKSDPGNDILTNDTVNYAKNGDHFWNLSIKLEIGTGIRKDDMFVIDTFFIEDEEIREAFIKALKAYSPSVKRKKELENDFKDKTGKDVVIISWGE